MFKVYLSGPIHGCSEEEQHEWRESVKRGLRNENFEFLDPTIRTYDWNDPASVKKVVEDDKRDIDQCDILLVNWTKPGAGTPMEMLYAWEREKLVVTIVPYGVHATAWVRYHSHIMLRTVRQGIDYLSNDLNPVQ